MKKISIGLLVVAAMATGYLLSFLKNSGEPRIKLLPFTANPNNGLAVLNFEVDGVKLDSILSEDGVGSPLGSIGDVTWSVDMKGSKNIFISAYNKKTKKASAVHAELPSGMSLVKTS